MQSIYTAFSSMCVFRCLCMCIFRCPRDMMAARTPVGSAEARSYGRCPVPPRPVGKRVCQLDGASEPLVTGRGFHSRQTVGFYCH